MSLEIHEAGLATTVQDRGRVGFYRFGIPLSGSLDQYSAAIANRLVGNGPDAAVLEAAYLGPKFSTTAATTIAVAGAPVTVLVNGEPRAQQARIALSAGDTVSFGVIAGGTRYYVAVTGGIDVPLVMGSRSTYSIGGLGGVSGRALIAGDVLPVGEQDRETPPVVETIAERPAFDTQVELRVVLGLYHHNLSAEGSRRLVESDWKLTPVADRMGMRYDGPGVEWRDRRRPFGAGQDASNIVDAGYAMGSIQIPGGTQPILLHREAVSGGGYAMVATVISADMDLAARSAPGTLTRFVPVSMDEAAVARDEYRRRFDALWG